MNDSQETPAAGPGKVVFARRGREAETPEVEARRARIRRECGLDGPAVHPPLFPEITLMAREALDQVTTREGITVWPGFCGEDLCTEDLDYNALRVGSLLRVGPALMLVVRKGKNCGGKCAVSQKTLDCPLSQNWMTAWVLREGDVRLSDSVTVVFDELEAVASPGAA